MHMDATQFRLETVKLSEIASDAKLYCNANKKVRTVKRAIGIFVNIRVPLPAGRILTVHKAHALTFNTGRSLYCAFMHFCICAFSNFYVPFESSVGYKSRTPHSSRT